MQQTTSAHDTGGEAAQRFRPTLAYSADGERRCVDDWMRRHGLWRTSLYHLLQRHPSLRLIVEGDAVHFRPREGGFAVSLRVDGKGATVDAGGMTVRFAEAAHAVGVFHAAVSGSARLTVSPADMGFLEQRLQLADACGLFVDVAVARDWCEHVTAAVLVNPAL